MKHFLPLRCSFLLIVVTTLNLVVNNAQQVKGRVSVEKAKAFYKNDDDNKKTMEKNHSKISAAGSIRKPQPQQHNATLPIIRQQQPVDDRMQPKAAPLLKTKDTKLHQAQQHQKEKQSETQQQKQQQQQQQQKQQQQQQQQQQLRFEQEAKLLEKKRKDDEEERQRSAAATAQEQIRLQREKAFEMELARMTKEQQKAAQRQKKKDARVVRRVLRSFQRQRLYDVLGLRNWELTIPPISFPFLSRKFDLCKLGPFFHLTSKTITRAYRTRAVQVHPDKNRDGRAEEAFVAVNQAATILLDTSLRKAYDDEQRQIRTSRRRAQLQVLHSVVNKMIGIVARITNTTRSLLGPFFLPFLILGALMV